MKMQRANFRSLLETVRIINSTNRRTSNKCKHFIYGRDVEIAKKNGLPIVALESTIITHGMPYPDNLRTAVKVEDTVRKKGAVPATIGILHGQIYVGLNKEQLQILAKSSADTIKCSRRDLSTVVAKKLNGGTTVSATMLIANLAGLPIMATGGIGGVHRGAESTFDISTDLIELGRTPVAVVCSGIKSILDIEKTLEYLETQGVPVIKIGETDYFPAFYCTETFQRTQVPHRVSDAQEAAKILKAQIELGFRTGLLFAVPIPQKYALDCKEIETAIRKALENAKSRNISGKNVTPFLLEELNQITRGESLQANIALIENNASVAAEIALNLAERSSQSSHVTDASQCVFHADRNPVIIGGAVIDTVLQIKDSEIKDDGRTHASRSRESCGGVGRNIASGLISLGLKGTRLISVVGNDQPGKAIIKDLRDAGKTVEQLTNMNTARFTVIINHMGECHFGISEMEMFANMSPDFLKKHKSIVENASIIVLDGNLPLDTIRYALDLATHSKIPVWYEPTDIRMATKVFEAKTEWRNVLHFISPNKDELAVIGKYFGLKVPDNKLIFDLEEVKTTAEQIAEFIPVVIGTLGSQGVLVARKASGNDPFYDKEGKLITHNISSRLYPPLSFISDDPNETFSVSGCGDCLDAGLIYGIHKNLNETDCISLALKAAALSLTSLEAVPASLSLLSINTKR